MKKIPVFPPGSLGKSIFVLDVDIGRAAAGTVQGSIAAAVTQEVRTNLDLVAADGAAAALSCTQLQSGSFQQVQYASICGVEIIGSASFHAGQLIALVVPQHFIGNFRGNLTVGNSNFLNAQLNVRHFIRLA